MQLTLLVAKSLRVAGLKAMCNEGDIVHYKFVALSNQFVKGFVKQQGRSRIDQDDGLACIGDNNALRRSFNHRGDFILLAPQPAVGVLQLVGHLVETGAHAT